MTRPHSLKRRLLMLTLAMVTFAWTSAALFTYFDAHDEFGEMMDAHLAQSASLLIIQSSQNIGAIPIEHAPLLDKYAHRVAFQIWNQGKVLRLHSANAPSERFADVEKGFSDAKVAGYRWRVFSTWDPQHQNLIHVAERMDERDELASAVVENLLKPLIFSLPVLAILLWWSITQALLPLKNLSEAVAQSEPDNLNPLDTYAAPHEVQPLIAKLNQLFERIERFIQTERRFTADAAHELRTPVAAIKAQAQVARGASEAADRIHALDNAIVGCDRASRLIDQLLTLARIDILTDELAQPCRLRRVAAEVIALLAPSALEKNVHLELAEGEAVEVRGDPAMLAVLLRNLIDNAIRHTPSGTTVTVAASYHAGKGKISVSDNGPGIPEEEREKITERFYRPLGTKASGSGLGLSIVKRIVELHQATLDITAAAGQGLKVEVTFKA